MKKQFLFLGLLSCVGLAFGDMANPYGSCAHVTRGENPARTAALMNFAGMGWVRSDFDWWSVAPEKGKWNFANFDKVVADCEKNGVQLLPILGYSVKWANPTHEHLDEWGEYVRQVVTHYGKRLPVLEVWNEENIPGFWKNPNPTNYLAVLRKTYEVAKKIDPSIRVAFGGTAGVPFEFIEEVYRLGGSQWFDIMNIHPYSHPYKPEGTMDAQIDKLHNLMAIYGDGQKPIWITEVGWPTHSLNIPNYDILQAGLRVVDAKKEIWRMVYVPTREDGNMVANLIKANWPTGCKVEVCEASNLATRLAKGDVDAVVFPFTEDYAVNAMPAVLDFVKKGGTLIDFGGMPLWTPFAPNRQGKMVQAKNASPWNDRHQLRIQEMAWWMDKRYPESVQVYPTEAAAGVKGDFEGKRFINAAALKPGDKLIPLLSVKTNGIEAVCAGVYKFNSDFKGSIILNGQMVWSVATSDEERQAKMVARSLGIAFAEGIERFFWYEFRQPDVNPFDPESYFGMVHDNFAPKPAFGAYMTFIDRRPVGSKQVTGFWRSADEEVYFPQWQKPNGVYAGMIWSPNDEQVMRLEFKGDNVNFMDIKGAMVRPKREGKAWLVQVGDSPIYFEGALLNTEKFNHFLVPYEKEMTAYEYLEKIRSVARFARENNPNIKIGAGGNEVDSKFALEFIGFGESEEIDFWDVGNDENACAAENLKTLRNAFDSAGGKSVKLMQGDKCLDVVQSCKPAKLIGELKGTLALAGTGRAYLVDGTGKIIWQRTGCGNIHRVQIHDGYLYYSNGSLYRCKLPSTNAELVYKPDNCVGGGVLGFEVLENGNVVMAVNSTDEIIEWDLKQNCAITKFKVNAKTSQGDEIPSHGHLRMVHKTQTGTYIVCCGGAACVREYNQKGNLVAEFPVPIMAFDCARLANGNTLVTHLTGVTEWTPAKQVVWNIKLEDYPELKLAFLCGLQVLKNGNLVLGTWANGSHDATHATAFEITRDKKVVWAWYATQDVNMMGVSKNE